MLEQQNNVSVESLLDDDTIINEFRGCNPRLLGKMKNGEFEQLVRFLIEEPTLDDDSRLIIEQFFEREPEAWLQQQLKQQIATASTIVVVSSEIEDESQQQHMQSNHVVDKSAKNDESNSEKEEESGFGIGGGMELAEEGDSDSDDDAPPPRNSMSREMINEIIQEQKMEIEEQQQQQQLQQLNSVEQETDSKLKSNEDVDVEEKGNDEEVVPDQHSVVATIEVRSSEENPSAEEVVASVQTIETDSAMQSEGEENSGAKEEAAESEAAVVVEGTQEDACEAIIQETQEKENEITVESQATTEVVAAQEDVTVAVAAKAAALNVRNLATQRQLKYVKIERDNMFLFGLLLSFFEDEKESVNVTLAGYVSKVIISLMNIAKNKQREVQVLQYVFEKHSNVLVAMAQQLHCRSTVDVLVRFVTAQPGNSNNSSSSQEQSQAVPAEITAVKIQVIDALLAKMKDESSESEALKNTSAALMDIMNVYSTFGDGKTVLLHMISDEKLREIFASMTNPASSTNIVLQNATIICNIVQLFNTIEGRRSEDDENSLKEFDIDFEGPLKVLSLSIGGMIDRLETKSLPSDSQDTATTTMMTTYRQAIRPLGQARLKIVEIFCLLLKLDNFFVVQEIAQNNLHVVLLELFLQYEWNNMLHTFVERIIVQSAQFSSHAMRKALFTDAKLIQFLSESTATIESSACLIDNPPSHLHFRKGYLGHVTKIANFIQRLIDRVPDLSEYIDQEAWSKFKSDFLEKANLDNERNLGDHAIIDHDSPSHELNCSYNIDEIKLKSEEFLFGIFGQNETQMIQESPKSFSKNGDKNEASDVDANDNIFSQFGDFQGQGSQKTGEQSEGQKEVIASFDGFDQFASFGSMQGNAGSTSQAESESNQFDSKSEVSFDDMMKSFGFGASQSSANGQQNSGSGEQQQQQQQHSQGLSFEDFNFVGASQPAAEESNVVAHEEQQSQAVQSVESEEKIIDENSGFEHIESSAIETEENPATSSDAITTAAAAAAAPTIDTEALGTQYEDEGKLEVESSQADVPADSQAE